MIGADRPETSSGTGETPGPEASRRVLRGAIVVLSAALWACGPGERTIGSGVEYTPPPEHRVVVETVVDLSFDRAWDELIRRLSESSFRIATLERASRLVAVELDRSSDLGDAADTPGRYVDCGRSVRVFTGEDGTQRFEYEVAEPSRYRESDPVPGGHLVSDVSRRVELAARANVYLQPEGSGRTRITVNARYEIDFEISGSARFVPSDPDRPPEPPERFGPRVEAVRFSTFQPGQDRRSGGLTCRATGRFEHALIALANPAAAV